MPTQDVTQIAQDPNGFLIAVMLTCVALTIAVIYLYKSKERITDKFIDYVMKQNEFLNYGKKD